jgi:hypothetical protein
MTPQGIVNAARAAGLELIAVTDHNTARMAPIVAHVAKKHGLDVFYGMELQTREDVHLLAYFDDERLCSSFSEEVYALLPEGYVDPYGLGDQVAVDAEGNIFWREERFLVNGLDLSFREAVDRIQELGGLAVPAHVDREFFSVSSQLGGLPKGMKFSLIEVRGPTIPTFCNGAGILRTSDAHALSAIGTRVTCITFERPSIEELRLAALGSQGRSLRGEIDDNAVKR